MILFSSLVQHHSALQMKYEVDFEKLRWRYQQSVSNKLYRFQSEFLNLKNWKGNIKGNKLHQVKSI